jgi:hypothetical protein
MFPKRRLAALPVIAALAVAAPATLATAAPGPGSPVVSGPSCPDNYAGPTNLATGCPYYLMSYTVQYPGQPAFRCPVNWGTPQAPSQSVGGVGACAGVSQTH